MKVTLIHDYLREYGGAERVVEVLHEMYPDAPLYTSFVDWPALGDQAIKFRNWDIRTTWVQKNWIVKKFHSPLRFLTPLVWESLDLTSFDLVISSSGWFMCRGVVTRPNTLHISYIHHPPRNLYGFPTGTKPSAWVNLYAAIVNPFLRMYDYATAQRIDYLIANSEETRKRIKKYYRRDSLVIYPPVSKFGSQKSEVRRKGKYYLSVGRLTYAKRVDLAIEACNKLNLTLKIVGVGKEEPALRMLAGPTIEFLGMVDDQKLADLYHQAYAVVFCALQEDFGLVPVEAMSFGTPVIALAQGGVKETVIDGQTGVLFDQPQIESLVSAINKFQKLDYQQLSLNSKRQAAKFSPARFKRKLTEFIKDKINRQEKYKKFNS